MINEQRITFLTSRLSKEGITQLLFPEFFLFKNLQILLIEKLHAIGIPEEHIIVREYSDTSYNQLSHYRRSSQFIGQHVIQLNIIENFLFIKKCGDFSEHKVKDLILFSMLYAYGQAMFEFFESKEFRKIYREKPILVNHNTRLIDMFFPTAEKMGTAFANYVMGKTTTGHKHDAIGICIEQYSSLKFSPNAIETAKLPREDRILRQNIDELCSIIPPNLTPRIAQENNSSVVLEIALFLIRKDYKIQIIRGEGLKIQDDTKIEEFLDEGMTPYLFSHEAILCNGHTIIDFCAKAYGQEHPIIVGPKYKWKKLWQEVSISKELPEKKEELKSFDFEFSNENKMD